LEIKITSNNTTWTQLDASCHREPSSAGAVARTHCGPRCSPCQDCHVTRKIRRLFPHRTLGPLRDFHLPDQVPIESPLLSGVPRCCKRYAMHTSLSNYNNVK
jgi:hypothetical protein